MISQPSFQDRVAQIGERFGEVAVIIRNQIDHPKGSWMVAIHFGREAEDSPMVGGAAYGIGEELGPALEQALGEVGV